MAYSKGKAFENKLKEDFSKIRDAHIERLYDITNGYKSIRSRSDFVAFIYPNMFFLEAKSHQGNTFPFSELRQYNDLLEVAGIKGIRSGVVLWMIDHFKVVYIPILTIKRMKEDNKKSFNIKDLNTDTYRIFEIPSVRRRVFMDSDYSVLHNLEDGD